MWFRILGKANILRQLEFKLEEEYFEKYLCRKCSSILSMTDRSVRFIWRTGNCNDY